MDSKEWDELVNKVRKQINDLRTTLNQNETAASDQKKALEEATHDVEDLLVRPANPREVLFQLPLTLQTLTTQKLIGVFLISNTGNVVLHHGSGQRLLRIDPLSNKLPVGCFYNPEGKLLADEDLIWNRSLQGQTVETGVHIVLRDPQTNEEHHLEVSAIALRSKDEISGVVALFRDKTETVRAGEYIKGLCNTLEKQLAGIESAQKELRLFAEKLLETTGSRPAADEPQPSTAPTKKQGKRVLIVDDIPVNQKLLMMHLKKMDIETDLASNGLEAVNACKKKRFALILMDIDMPVLNGFEATAEIRKMENPLGIHTPIVAITSFDRDNDKEKCLREGMDEFIPKGSSKAVLTELVDKYVFGTSDAPIVPEPASTNRELKLDIRWLNENLGGEADKVVALFLGSAIMLLNCLEFSIEEKDAKAVTHFAYSLKGPCSSLGLITMAEKAAELCRDAESGRWSLAGIKYKQLCEMFETIKVEANKLFEGQLAK